MKIPEKIAEAYNIDADAMRDCLMAAYGKKKDYYSVARFIAAIQPFINAKKQGLPIPESKKDLAPKFAACLSAAFDPGFNDGLGYLRFWQNMALEIFLAGKEAEEKAETINLPPLFVEDIKKIMSENETLVLENGFARIFSANGKKVAESVLEDENECQTDKNNLNAKICMRIL